MRNKQDFIEAHLTAKINEAITMDFSLPAGNSFGNEVRYVGVPHPLKSGQFVLLRLMTIKDTTDKTEYTAYELAYQELSSYSYIKDRRFTNAGPEDLMNVALGDTPWHLGTCNISGTLQTNFYFINNLDAISTVIKGLGGEVVFYVTIQGNQITGRYMDYVVRQGEDTSKVFVHGSNLLTVERTGDNSNIYTAILPRGKGEQVSEGETKDDGTQTPDGYGRRITIEDIDWSTAKGNPLNKPKGDLVLNDPSATSEYGHIDGKPRLLVKTYDSIDNVDTLIKTAYNELMEVNHPAIQYSATIAETSGLDLGDTVLIMHNDRGLSYKTRVFEVNYDLINEANTTTQLGSDLSKNGLSSSINNLASTVNAVAEQGVWNISHGGSDGSGSTSYGSEEPKNPKKGDVWFKLLPNGKTEMYYFDGNAWILSAKTDQQWADNTAEQNGNRTVYRGTEQPKTPQKYDIWYKVDPNEENGIAMYYYSGSKWQKFETSASTISGGSLDFNNFMVKNLAALNISADQITSGHLSANFIKGGQIDASTTNVINMNVKSLVGDVSQFIKSGWDGKYGSTVIDGNGMTVTAANMKATFNTSGVLLNYGNYKLSMNSGGFMFDSGTTTTTLQQDGQKFDYQGTTIGYLKMMNHKGQANSYRGLSMDLAQDGKFLAFTSSSTADLTSYYVGTGFDPRIKLAWYRYDTKVNGANAGFNFFDDVTFNNRIIVGGADLSQTLKGMAQTWSIYLPTSVSNNQATGWVKIK
ncbi:phage tail spike protein [Eupransor demetentiae]